jgi:hypothetical protein
MVFVYFAFWGLQEEFSTLPCSPSNINWVKIGKQEPGTPFSKLLDLRLMQQRFWGYFHKKILRLTGIDRKLY